MLHIKNIETVIWDWNGTLLNDIDLCIESINKLLVERGLPLLTAEIYLNVFGFPVSEYYQKIGFNFEIEPFTIPAKQFIKHYIHRLQKCNLHQDVEKTLISFQQRNIGQHILSAMEQSKLIQSIQSLKIENYFDSISGLNNDYAATKEENGMALIKNHQLTPEKTVLIGDTVHDYEVANKMNCHCILIANGHQHFERLKQTEAMVFANLKELTSYFKI